MPLLRFDVIEGRDDADIKKLLDTAHYAMVKAFDVPVTDRYQIVHQHRPHELIIEDTGLGFKEAKILSSSALSAKRAPNIKKKRYIN